MVEKIICNLNAQVVGGPKLPANIALDVEAYDKFDLKAQKVIGGTPGTAKAEIGMTSIDHLKFVLITSSDYTNLTFKSKNGITIKLDAPLMLIRNAIILLKGVEEFNFENASDKDAEIAILIGRDSKP